jgi:hypothetical protein
MARRLGLSLEMATEQHRRILEGKELEGIAALFARVAVR